MADDARTARTTILDGALAGSRVIRLHPELIRVGREQFSVAAPVPGVPELLAAFDQERVATKLRADLATGLDRRGTPPHQPNESLVFDLRQAAGLVVTSVKSGVEAFANWHAIRIIEANPGMQVGGEDFNLDFEMHRYLPERLEGLPALFSVEGRKLESRPNQQRWWRPMRTAIALADLVRHGVEEPVTRSGLSDRRSLLARLLRGEEVGSSAAMFSAFEYFAPGWVPESARRVFTPGDRS